MSEGNKPKQPKFTLEFKQDAARWVIEKGYTCQRAADSLGVSLSALRRSVRAEVAAGEAAGCRRRRWAWPTSKSWRDR